MGGLLPVVPIQLPVYLWAVWKKQKNITSAITPGWSNMFKKKKAMCSDKSAKEKMLKWLMTVFNDANYWIIV